MRDRLVNGILYRNKFTGHLLNTVKILSEILEFFLEVISFFKYIPKGTSDPADLFQGGYLLLNKFCVVILETAHYM